MLLPIKWLKEYVELDVDSRTLADNLTLSGSHVESIISQDRGIENVVVGRIESIERLEDTKRLSVALVDVGKEALQLVTGAPNLEVGKHVAVALIGAKLPGSICIEKTSFNGIESNGMLCSLKELGYGDNIIPKYQRDGIFIFDKEYPLGTDVSRILGLYDEIIELEITPNRPDCLSIIGMARETAATFNKKLELPEIVINNEVENIKDYVKDIDIDNKLCNRYLVRVIKDMEIKESPLWLQIKLMEAGMRPINNIVDITNYVMLEFGQPLHAFDLDKLESKRILVRRAKEGEKMKTLDDQERELSIEDLLITDGEVPVAIAGVMGGFDTEITEGTTTVLLESANFNKDSVRITSKRHNLRTEASSRFEKGIDPTLCQIAAERVCQLVEEVGAGKVVKGCIDIYESKWKQETIQLRPNRVNDLLDTDLNKYQMIDYLERLGLETRKNNNQLEVKIPTYRMDLNIEADLIEEIGRLHGFHNIPTKPLIGALTKGEKPYSRVISDKAGSILRSLGLNEVITYSFISPRSYDKINIEATSKLRDYIELINPLGEDYSVMRTTLIPNMLELLSRNFNRGIQQCYLFEIGNVFIPKELPLKCLPEEKRVLSIGMYGKADFYDLKEVVVSVYEKFGIRGLEYVRECNNPTFHPNRTANIMKGPQNIGILGEIHIDALDNYDLGIKAYIAHLDFDAIIENASLQRRHMALPKHPAILRDIAVVVDNDVLVGDLEKAILGNGEDLIEKIELFDVYEGKQIAEGKKSVGFSITYRSYERTLKDEEVNIIHKGIIRDLGDKFNAKLRE